nr:DUF418 domain-containing protein [Pseudoxanthomonas sp.]
MQQDVSATATPAPTETGAALTPIDAGERIAALDVIRGFALIGIFLMNVEWFTRPISELGRGIDPSLHGLDYAVSWGVYVLVQGKFWTLFSLLFGIGFAVMLGRAESRGRAFVTPYLRRILGLMLFGIAHFILIWTGDILHNYAITALALLLVVTRSWKLWLGILLSFVVASIALKSDALGASIAVLVLVGVLMFFLNRGSLARWWKWGVTLYSLMFVLGLVGAGVTAVYPQIRSPETAEQTSKRQERLAERAKERVEEIRIDSRGTYAEAVRYRAGKFAEDIQGAAGLSFMALPMFMIGFWFVRAGVIARLRDHAALFRRLATWTLPVGMALTLLSVWMVPSFPGDGLGGRDPARMAAMSLFQLGALLLCLGYFAGMVLLLGTRMGRWLAPLGYAGRMALTNYIGASLAGTLFFFGYGLGYWGQLSRPGQMAFVAVVFALQVGFSYLWLRHFRYGPLEWAWRALTYWQWPVMRRSRNVAAGADGTVHPA